MGFTQRQAGGKFTRDEAEAFIEQLRAGAESETGEPPPAAAVKASAEPERTVTKPTAPKPAAPKAGGQRTVLTAAEKQLRRIPTPELAAELQRRGWIVVEP